MTTLRNQEKNNVTIPMKTFCGKYITIQNFVEHEKFLTRDIENILSNTNQFCMLSAKLTHAEIFRTNTSGFH